MHGGMVAYLSEQLGRLNLSRDPMPEPPAARLDAMPGSLAMPLPGQCGRGGNPARDGFRHFIREPKPEELCRHRFLPGDDAATRAANAAVKARLSGLAQAMGGGDASANPNLPSGYTYLLQFVAHDLVHTSVALASLDEDMTGIVNLRLGRLRLDGLYGGGPFATPAVYEAEVDTSYVRGRLRVGGSKGDKLCPMRDIGRATAADASGPLFKAGEPLLADPRNDDSAILSQLTALFHHLHNHILAQLGPAASEPAANADRNGAQAEDRTEALLRFLCARECTTLIYRNVVRRDLLPRLLDPRVLKAYTTAPVTFLDGVADDCLPLEFCFGVFRFAHAMVRQEYVLSEGAPALPTDEALRRTSTRNSKQVPLEIAWIVQWGRFFPKQPNDPTANYSRLIGPSFTPPLGDADLFPPADGAGTPGLPYYDLHSAAAVGLWSVDALVAELRASRPDLVALSPLLSDAAKRRQALHDWLTCIGIDAAAADALAADPPLSVYVLFEAANEAAPGETKGQRLGVLGSIMVAEVMFRALDANPVRWERPEAGLAEYLRRVIQTLLPDAAARASISDISTMREVVEFTAGANDLRNTSPAFV